MYKMARKKSADLEKKMSIHKTAAKMTSAMKSSTENVRLREREKERTYVDESIEVTGSEVVQDRSLVEIGHVGHVLAHLKLRWVDLLEVILLHSFVLEYKK